MPRVGLDKDAVVEAAANFLNTEGAEALTLSRLAQELGVKTPSLYNHVDGLPGLYRELALLNARTLGERLLHHQLNELFEGVADATEEAILNAVCMAETMTGHQGHTVYALPLDELQTVMKKYRR